MILIVLCYQIKILNDEGKCLGETNYRRLSLPEKLLNSGHVFDFYKKLRQNNSIWLVSC